MRVKPGDIDGSGALLSGNSVNLNLSRDLSARVDLKAKGNVNLDSVTTGQSESIRWSSRNSRIDGSSSETGTTVSGGTNVAINAGGDITAGPPR